MAQMTMDEDGEIVFTSRNEHLIPDSVKFVDADIGNIDILNLTGNRRRRSPIMLEFGQRSISAVDLQRAMEAGTNIIKYNVGYCTEEENLTMLSNIDKAAANYSRAHGLLERPIASCTTLKTWLIKSGLIRDDLEYVIIRKDSLVTLTNDKSFLTKTDDRTIFIDYVNLTQDLRPNMEISIDGGEVILNSNAIIDSKSVECVVVKGGKLKNMATVCIRDFVRTAPFLTKKDIQILKFCCKYQVDMITVYYVPNGEALKEIKSLISKAKFKPLIYSGVCSQAQLDHLEDIIKESDGILFSRSLFQYEIDAQKVYKMIQIQKWLAGMCIRAGKPLFLTGGVFKTLVKTGEICDAEISDITNAILDGITGFVLKDCQNIQNTMNALFGLNEICCEVEPLSFNKSTFWRLLREPRIPVNAAEAAIVSAVTVANQTNSRVIVIPTVTGLTVRALMLLRPSCIIITISSRPHVARSLCFCRNVVPMLLATEREKSHYRTIDSRVDFAAKYAVYKSWLKTGDMYISLQRHTAGSPFCDMVRILTITFNKKLLIECHYSNDEESKSEDIVQLKHQKKKKKKKEKTVTNVQSSLKNEDMEQHVENGGKSTDQIDHEEHKENKV